MKKNLNYKMSSSTSGVAALSKVTKVAKVSSTSSTSVTTLQKIKDFTELYNVLPTYLSTAHFDFSQKKVIQVNLTTFIRCIHDGGKSIPDSEKDNILILRGGIRWYNTDAFYLKSASSYFTDYVRVFLLEKFDPMVNMDFSDDLIDVMNYIKKSYSGRLVVIGYSMGAILLSAYLAKTKAKEADLFILCCNSFNMQEFRQVLNKHSLFKWIQERDLASFGAKSLEELIEKEGIDIERQEELMNNLIHYLNKSHKRWHPKTLYVIAEKDPITLNYKKTLEEFDKKPYTLQCKGAWHCCSRVTAATFEYAYAFFDLSNKNGKSCRVKDILNSI